MPLFLHTINSRVMKNRFNNITSKEWLPFQKSWFIYQDNEKLYNEHIRFFIKYDDSEFKPNLYYYGDDLETLKKVSKKNGAYLISNQDEIIQYALIDLRGEIEKINSVDEYKILKREIINITKDLFNSIKDRRFVSIILQNKYIDNIYYPFAWDLSYSISTGFSLKDEKIGCLKTTSRNKLINGNFFVLNFRKDEKSGNKFEYINTELINKRIKQLGKTKIFSKKWDIIKPPPRNKKEILHPAKFPENLISDFIENFTDEKDNVFDPMSGTGSTQLAALQTNRNGYGTELSNFFTKIANDRLKEYLKPNQISFFPGIKKEVSFKILNKDVRTIKKDDFPTIDYIITSPPYWDMLNMKGAENQEKRKEKGLKLNYTDSNKDFGNIPDYEEFINDLVEVYFNIIEYLKPGGHLTIIVKNIKKKGKNYPFAWDLSRKLSERLILLPEFFWLQDDINLAPYGYGNTFVTNTFHQYCLNFKKPEA